MRPEWLRQLPYLVHTNRELGLMLKGVKPLACFWIAIGKEPDCLIRYIRMFDRHANAGRFVRRAVDEPLRDLPELMGRKLFYALPGQEWRIEAMLSLLELRGPWTQDRERRQGELLGYEDWQNDLWLAGRGGRFPAAAR